MVRLRNNCQLSIVNCQLMYVLLMGSGDFIILSKCQTNRLRMPFVAPKYGLVTGKGLLGRFAKYILTGFSSGWFPFVLFFPPVRSLSSVFSDGRTQYHTSEIVPLRGLKNENTPPFSYGRVGTTVRTRRYGGADASVRSQSQVLLFVERGAKEAFSALERVCLCEIVSI